MKIFIASLLIFFGAAGLMPGCGGESAAPPADTGSSAESAPVDGDALVSAEIGEPSNLIPALSNDTASSAITEYVYNGLLKYDRDMNIVPALAESLEILDDGLTLVFRLRRDVRWHDGAPFTARDALFSYELMIDPKTPTAYAESYKQVKTAEMVDDYTFKVTYDRPLALALNSWCFNIMPEHLLKDRELDGHPLARNPVGTGPYKFEKWESGQRVSLTANDDYFEGRPHIDRLVMRIIPDLNAQMMELMSGGIDTMSLTPDQYEEKKGDRNFTSAYNIFRYPAWSYAYLGFNLRDERFADRKVRQAISLAIDQQEIIDGVLLGLGVPANGPFPPAMWASNENVKPYPYDPERARALLAEAGWIDRDGDGVLDKDGRKLEFTIMTNQGNKMREQTGLIIQARLAEVGIKASLRIVEWASFLKEYLDKGNFETIIMGWTVPVLPQLFDVWHSSKTNPGELNFVGFQNEEVDRLIDEARFTLDQSVQKRAYDRIQEILHQEAPYVFLYIPETLPVYSNRFQGLEVGPRGLGHNFIHWYVPLDQQKYTR